jgi:hypothetical protein
MDTASNELLERERGGERERRREKRERRGVETILTIKN